MNAFDYAAPQSVDEALSLLSNGKQVGLLAGGTDIIAAMKEGRRKIDLLLDLKKIPDTQVLSYDAENGLRVGAATACCKIYENEDVRKKYPALVDSTSLIGSIQVQSRASIGGNLCNSSPAADSIPTLIVLSGTCHIVGPNGTRTVAVEDFCTGPGQNVLGNGEFLVSLTFPSPAPNSGAFFLRFIPRNEMDIAVVNAAVSVVLSDDHNSIVSARVAIGAVAPTPLLVTEAGDALAGQAISDDVIEKAAEASRAAANPITDMRGTIEQRVHLAGVPTRRALQGAIERAKES